MNYQANEHDPYPEREPKYRCLEVDTDYVRFWPNIDGRIDTSFIETLTKFPAYRTTVCLSVEDIISLATAMANSVGYKLVKEKTDAA